MLMLNIKISSFTKIDSTWKHNISKLFVFTLLLISSNNCTSDNRALPNIVNNFIGLEFNNKMYSRIILPDNKKEYLDTTFSSSEFIIVEEDTIKDFNLKEQKIVDNVETKTLTVSGIFLNNNLNIEKIVIVKFDKKFPQILSTKVKYINHGKKKIKIDQWVNNHYLLPVKDTSEIVWSYQSGSYEERPDWVLQVKNNFYQENYLGMNASDYGGGTPVSDIWKKNVGIAVGHLENVPKLVSLPVSRKNNNVSVEVNQKKQITIQPGKSFDTYETFVTVHKGDYFSTLSAYSLLMQKRGLKFKNIDDVAYEPIWCAWGYERNFKVKDILATLPKVKELGFKWVVLDDGWQTAEGDWYLNPKKFPNSDDDMIDFVNKIHSYGLKAKLWWAPLAVDPGTDLIKNHKDLLLINKKGKPQDITWWDSYYLCPAYQPTIDYTNTLVKKMIQQWGFDGLKIDGQHMNAAPPCYNPKHNHKYPEESVEAMPKFYDSIFETVTKLKKEAVVEICPCGDAYSYFMLPYINQPVSSDPTSSWQIRLKGKTMKALMGTSAPYYGDHVELSSGGDDFASTVGVGGVVGSKFTWPVGVYVNSESGDVSLTPKKEKEWKKWISLYNKYMLPKGKYLGSLYDIGFDKPETHVIQKGNSLFYAFYADKFDGIIKLRGLKKTKQYYVFDYVKNKKLDEISGKNPRIKVKFNKYLLIKVTSH